MSSSQHDSVRQLVAPVGSGVASGPADGSSRPARRQQRRRADGGGDRPRVPSGPAVCCRRSAEADVNAELERLVRAEVVYRQGRAPNVSYIFKHALIQDAAYESMIKKSARACTRSIAACLADELPGCRGREPETQALPSDRGRAARRSDRPLERGRQPCRPAFQLPEALAHLTRGVGTAQAAPRDTGARREEYRLNVPLGIASLSLRGYASPELGELYERRVPAVRADGRRHGTAARDLGVGVVANRSRRGRNIAKQLADRIIALAGQDKQRRGGPEVKCILIRARSSPSIAASSESRGPLRTRIAAQRQRRDPERHVEAIFLADRAPPFPAADRAARRLA